MFCGHPNAINALLSFLGVRGRGSGAKEGDVVTGAPVAADNGDKRALKSKWNVSGVSGVASSSSTSPDSQSILRLRSDLRSRSDAEGRGAAVEADDVRVDRFTAEEMDVLLRLHRLLLLEDRGEECSGEPHRESEDHRNESPSKDGDSMIGERGGDAGDRGESGAKNGVKKSREAKEDDKGEEVPFLLTLATCAARAAAEETERYHRSQSWPEDGSGDLLQQVDDAKRATRRAAVRQRKRDAHLRRVQHLHRCVLPPGLSTALGRALGPLRDGRTLKGEVQFLNEMAGWLGRRGSASNAVAADLVFDCCRWSVGNDEGEGSAAPDDLADAADIASLCYRLAVSARCLDPDRCPPPLSSSEDAGEKTTAVNGGDVAEMEAIFGSLGSTKPLADSLLEYAARHQRDREEMERRVAQMRNKASGEPSQVPGVVPACGPSTPLSWERMVTHAAFSAWCVAEFPDLAGSLPALMGNVTFPPLIMDDDDDGAGGEKESSGLFTRTRRERLCPIPNMPPAERSSTAFFSSPNSPGLYALAAVSRQSLGGTWRRLFSTSTDGFSFHRLEHCVCGYGGPTLLLIRAYHPQQDGLFAIFGAYASAPWKSAASFHGNDRAFLFQLQPMVRIMKAKKDMKRGNIGRGGNYQYLNTSTGVGKAPVASSGAGIKGRHTTGAAGRGGGGMAKGKGVHGLGMGGSVSRPRLFVSEAFDYCCANASDTTFEDGELFPLSASSASFPPQPGSQVRLELESLEIWAAGSSDVVGKALADQERHWGVVQSNINKARKVDRAAFLGDLKSGLIENKLFVHREQMRGREGGCCLMENDEV